MGLTTSKIDWSAEPSNRERIYFFVILFLVVVAFARVFWLPSLAIIEKNKADIKSVKMQIKILEDFVKINQKIAPQKPKISKEAVDLKLEEALKGKTGKPHDVISSVTQVLAGKDVVGNLSLQNISFKAPHAESGYAKFPITIEVLGTFSNIQSYLSKLEKIDYLFTVDNIKMLRSEEHSGLLTGDLSCSLYVVASGSIRIQAQKEQNKDSDKDKK